MDTEKEIIEYKAKVRKLELQIEAMKKLLYQEGIIIEEDLDRVFNELMKEVYGKL